MKEKKADHDFEHDNGHVVTSRYRKGNKIAEVRLFCNNEYVHEYIIEFWGESDPLLEHLQEEGTPRFATKHVCVPGCPSYTLRGTIVDDSGPEDWTQIPWY